MPVSNRQWKSDVLARKVTHQSGGPGPHRRAETVVRGRMPMAGIVAASRVSLATMAAGGQIAVASLVVRRCCR